jgi:hypothetical protein
MRYFNSKRILVHDALFKISKSDYFISKYVNQFHEYEPIETEFLRKNIHPGESVLNIGAHVGIFSALISKLVGVNGTITAVEPENLNYHLLKSNMRKHAHPNWKAYNFAAGSEDSISLLHVNQRNSGDHRLFDPSITQIGGDLGYQGFNRTRVQSVSVRRLDNVFKGRVFDFILIDAQGWDHDVLLGAKELISENKPMVLMEFVPGWLEARGIKPNETLEFYRSLGYSYKLLEFDNEINLTAVEIQNLMDQNNLFFCNLILFQASHRLS